MATLTRRGKRLVWFLGAVVVLIIILVAIGGGSKSAPKYSVANVSVIVASPSELSVDFSVTNTGNATGTPKCVMSAGSTNVTAKKVSAVKPTDVDVVLNELMAIPNHDAASASKSLTVSCS